MRICADWRSTTPSSGVSAPVMSCSCVVFPAPLTPTRPTRSPFLHSQETFFRTCAFLKVSETFSRRTPEGTVCAAAAAAAAEALPRPARAEALDDFEEEELEGESSPSSSASAAASSEAAAATGAGEGGGGAAAALPCVFLMTIFWMRFFLVKGG